MRNIYDLGYSEIEDFIQQSGEPSFRANQIWQGLYLNRYTNWESFSSVPKSLRKELKNTFNLASITKVNSVYSNDLLTERVVFQTQDFNYIETVLLRKTDRLTLCISTQIGCPVACVFCATGNLGFARNLSSGEIIEQVLFFISQLEQSGEKLTNIVLMGMGEPFLNYDNTLQAISRMNDASSLNIGARRITVSTIGIAEKIRRFSDKGLQVNLSISLHAPNDGLRQKLVPLAKSNSLADITDACQIYFEKTKRRITFEYVMIDGINDSPSMAFELVSLIRNLNCHVNLISLNSTTHYLGKPSQPAAIREFGRILIEKGIAASIRDSQGSDIQAGCGQLAGKLINNN